MTPQQLESLYAAVGRQTNQNPRFLGCWIRRYADADDKTWSDLAEELGTSIENVVLLCLCRTPRPESFQDDLRVVCERTGAREEVVARIIRQEQALKCWQEETPTNNAGWLSAASDGEEPHEPNANAESDGNEN